MAAYWISGNALTNAYLHRMFLDERLHTGSM
jgi:hypothetical protein